MVLGIHWLDSTIVMLYFAVVLYVGVLQGGRHTRTLGDFFVAERELSGRTKHHSDK
ncbi:MAG: hypothetical protein JSW47_16890 [Phycisphaerales bacterium]|nr:MAG: hypothetical protein JSW47_16890 [Phycisphaerales bacterium]